MMPRSSTTRPRPTSSRPSRFLPTRETWWRLLLLAPLAGAAWLLSVPDPQAPDATDSGPALQADNVPIVLRQNGQILCKITARRVTVSNDHRTLLAEDVRGGTLYQNGKPALQISAARVRFAQDSGNVWASGKVRAQGENLSLASESAFWNKNAARLLCPQSAQATWRGVDLQAKGAFYDAKSRRFVCPNPSRALLPGKAEMRATRAVAELPTHLLRLSGEVVLVMRPTTKLVESFKNALPRNSSGKRQGARQSSRDF